MRGAIAALVVLVGAACKSERPRWLVVEERVELCAVAPSSTPLDQMQATQWRLGIEAGEYELPRSQGLDARSSYWSPSGSPMPPLLDVRDVDDANPFAVTPEGAVVEDVNLLFRPDDARDVLLIWASVDTLFGESGSWKLSLTIEAEKGEDFRIEDPRKVHFGCFGGPGTSTCPHRSFDACDPGGPTVRTRVALDRGEVVLDVRYVEHMPPDGDFTHEMFVASEVRVDDVALVQSDFFRLLHAVGYPEIGDGEYVVLAPETLEPAGLGCGIAVTDLGTEQPQAFTVDCALQELESLAIVATAREVLP